MTGAGSGIGRALARDLAGRGAVLALSDIDQARLEETRALIGAGDNRHRFGPLDVADAAAVTQYAALLAKDWGPADWLINNAGISRIGEFADTPAEAFDQVWEVNFQGVVRMSRAFLPQLIETKGGLVNISSLFGLVAYPGQAHYCASKFAVRGFSEALAMELAGKGVCVTCVHPGGIRTDIVNNAALDALPAGVRSKEKLARRFDKSARTSPEQAARMILNGAQKGRRRVVVGADGRMIPFLQRLFPQSYQALVARAAGGK